MEGPPGAGEDGQCHGPLELAHVSESQNRVSSYRIFAKQATRSICPLSFIFPNLQIQFKFWRWSPIFQNCKYNSSSDGDLLFSKIGQTWLRIMGDMQDKWPKQGHFGQNKAIPCSFAVWVKKQGILCQTSEERGRCYKAAKRSDSMQFQWGQQGGNGMQEKPEEIECNEERPIARAGGTASPV